MIIQFQFKAQLRPVPTKGPLFISSPCVLGQRTAHPTAGDVHLVRYESCTDSSHNEGEVDGISGEPAELVRDTYVCF